MEQESIDAALDRGVRRDLRLGRFGKLDHQVPHVLAEPLRAAAVGPR